MIYAYKCNVCGARIDSSSRYLTSCPECLSMALRRDYSSVQIGTRAFRPHYNHAVGAYVRTDREFNDLLRAKGDEAGSAYTRVDPGDVPGTTQDDYILDAQARTIRDKGIDPSTLVE
jgi:hypothetical protein